MQAVRLVGTKDNNVGGVMMLFLLLYILWLILGFILAIFVAEDAFRDGREYPVWWGVAIYFLGVFVFAIYYLTKPRYPEWKQKLTESKVRMRTFIWCMVWSVIMLSSFVAIVATRYALSRGL